MVLLDLVNLRSPSIGGDLKQERVPSMPGIGIKRLVIEAGKTYALVGKSGIGKSVFLSCLYGYPPAGLRSKLTWDQWRLFGASVDKANLHWGRSGQLVPPVGNSKIIYLPQNFPVDKSSNISALNAMAFFLQIGCRHMTWRRANDLVKTIAERFGIARVQLENPLAKLSGGQRRRLELLVRLYSISSMTEDDDASVLILLDEPTSGLDAQSERLFLEFIYHIKENADFKHLAIGTIVATHAFGRITPGESAFDDVLVLQKNENTIELIYSGGIEELFQQQRANSHAGILSFWEKIISLSSFPEFDVALK